MRESGRHIHPPRDKLPYPYTCPRATNWRWLTRQAALRTTCSRPTAALLDAASKHTGTLQSRQVTLVSFTSLSAGSDTVTSLYRVLFHLSLVVLFRYWSQTYIQLWMKFTTHFMHQSQGTWLFESTPCTKGCRWHTGLSPLSMLFSKSSLLRLNW